MTQSTVWPSVGSAEVHVLTSGYVDIDQSPWSVASTVTYVRDGDTRIIVDPGMVPGPAAVLDPLRDCGALPEDITDVVFSHHHPDHTINAALFPQRAHPRPLGDLPQRHLAATPRGGIPALELGPADRDTRTHPAGHHHPRDNAGGNRGTDPPLVDPARPSGRARRVMGGAATFTVVISGPGRARAGGSSGGRWCRAGADRRRRRAARPRPRSRR
jgi:glyoxylase-like metal-dependent hydrolase (beta-lactamase superfamily II)